MNDENQYPLGTLIPYGPDLKRATKLTVCIIPTLGAEPTAVQRWHVKTGEIREDSKTALEIEAFFAEHEVVSRLDAPEIMGCEHEEGIDFPLGGFCTKCAMWSALEHAKSHRTGKTPEGNGKFITPDAVIDALAEVRGCPPEEAFKAADFHREALIDPLIAGIHEELAGVEKGDWIDSQLACHALLLMGKWGEPKALPAVLRWFSLNEAGHDLFSGDVMLEDGAAVLAFVAGRDIPEIRALIEDPATYEYSRGVALDALAVLVHHGKMGRDELVAYLRELIAEKLEREESLVWNHVATVIADLGITELIPELREPYEEGWIDGTYISWQEIRKIKVGEESRYFQEKAAPITDVAQSTGWWTCYHGTAVKRSDEPESIARNYEHTPYIPPLPAVPFIAEPKIERNAPCPCNSGKKYKKCCGAA